MKNTNYFFKNKEITAGAAAKPGRIASLLTTFFSSFLTQK